MDRRPKETFPQRGYKMAKRHMGRYFNMANF